ncbi:MAG: tryptophan-rich sensory protein [Sphaerochaetaceae bacterium]|nr:tryptophan-rich sensory protein [Sphaerochaetaceae bacterium]
MDRTKKAWISGLFLLVTLCINTLGALGMINGLSQKAISDMYITLITPSGATFSIWSVIYLLLIASIIMMIVKKEDPYYQTAIDKITRLFWLSCILNVAWIVSFSYVLIEISVIWIVAFVVVLSLICKELLAMHEEKRWLLPVSFGMYTGWLFIATVVNISAALVKLGWNGFGIPIEILSIITLIVAILLALFVLIKNQNPIFPLPIAWAFFGIFQNLKSAEGFMGKYSSLETVAIIGMFIFILMALFQFYRNHFTLLPVKIVDEK